jgi:hypothetical protein
MLIITISSAFASLQATLKLSKQAMNDLDLEYNAERDAHRCGRSIAALANLTAITPFLGKHKDQNTKKKVTDLVKQLSTNIEQSVEAFINPDHQSCTIDRVKPSHVLLDEFNQYSSPTKRPNYGYRLIPAKGDHHS